MVGYKSSCIVCCDIVSSGYGSWQILLYRVLPHCWWSKYQLTDRLQTRTDTSFVGDMAAHKCSYAEISNKHSFLQCNFRCTRKENNNEGFISLFNMQKQSVWASCKANCRRRVWKQTAASVCINTTLENHFSTKLRGWPMWSGTPGLACENIVLQQLTLLRWQIRIRLWICARPIQTWQRLRLQDGRRRSSIHLFCQTCHVLIRASICG